MCLEIIFSGITALATGLIAITSCRALSNWKDEKVYDLAIDIVDTSREFEALLKDARHRSQVMRTGEEYKENANVIPWAIIRQNWSTIVRLRSLGLKAIGRFKNEKVNENIEELINVVTEIETATVQLTSGVHNNAIVEIVWSSKNDSIEAKVKQAVEEIEKKLKRYYER